MTTIVDVLKALQIVTKESGEFTIRWDAKEQLVDLRIRLDHDGRVVHNRRHIDRWSLKYDESLNHESDFLFVETKKFLDQEGM